MALTLNQLIEEATKISQQLTSGDIPVVVRGRTGVTLILREYEEALWVEIKPNTLKISPEEFKSMLLSNK